MRWPAVLLFSLQIVTSPASVNYCGARMCGHTDEHTFCKYSGRGQSCTGYINAPLSYEDKSRILARLNRRRNDIALGLKDWPPAADMLKLRWVEELSREAQLWADQCRPPDQTEEHDLCHDMYSTTVGQCVASIVGEAPGLRPETMVDIWYMQRVSYEGNFTSYVPPVKKSQFYGDFAQLVWSRTYMVGCGRSRFMAPSHGRFRSVERLVCNFAPRGPVPFRALWTLGPAASMCPPRSRPDHHSPGLCSFQNNLNVSDDRYNKLSAEEHLLLDTVLEVESYDTFDDIGFFDETFLKKVAISNLTLTPTDEYKSFFNKREVIEDLESDESVNTTQSLVTDDKNSTIKREQMIKVSVLGRYKPFDLEDLEDLNTSDNLINGPFEETTHIKELYAEYLDMEEIYDTIPSNFKSKPGYKWMGKSKIYAATRFADRTEDSNANDKNVIKLITTMNVSNDQTVVTDSSNYTTNDVLDDYLADPETYRQLQEALERMENNLAVPVSTAGKVRRELRTLAPNKTALNRRKQNVMSPDELQAEIEPNRTLDRGPMLNLVLKYLPYLKPYEKTIMGDGTSGVARLMPNIFALILCF